jgi:hypothetical protein
VSDVLDRLRFQPARSAAARREPVGSVWVRGAFAASWSVAVGVAALIVLALVVWAADSQSVASAGGAMRFAAQLWLLAHRTPLRVHGGSLTIPPLALTLVLGMLLARATAIVARGTSCTTAGELGTVVASVALPYAVLAAVLAAITQSSSFRPSVGAAFVCALLIGGLAATIGAARATGIAGQTWRSLPVDLRGAVGAAGASAVVLLAAAMLLAVGSLIVHAHEFGTLVSSYRSGPGEFSMLLLSLLMLPNAVLFALGYLVGPGFAIGAGTSVGYGGAHLGAVPAFPLLAAVPSGRAPWLLMTVAIAAVVAAGAAAGWRVARLTTLTVQERARSVFVAGALLGTGAAILVGFAGGPAGPGRLSAVGPSPWQVGLTVAGEISLVALITVLAAAWTGLARKLASGSR